MPAMPPIASEENQMLSTRRWLIAVAGGFVASLVAGAMPAAAQKWPQRAVKFIVPLGRRSARFASHNSSGPQPRVAGCGRRGKDRRQQATLRRANFGRARCPARSA